MGYRLGVFLCRNVAYRAVKLLATRVKLPAIIPLEDILMTVGMATLCEQLGKCVRNVLPSPRTFKIGLMLLGLSLNAYELVLRAGLGTFIDSVLLSFSRCWMTRSWPVYG